MKRLIALFEEYADNAQAPVMEAYMKGVSPFLGIKKPIRARITKDLMKDFLKDEELDPFEFVKLLWSKPYREFHYFAMEYAEKKKLHKRLESIDLFEWMIINKSWWDTVDFIASHLVGKYFKEHPEMEVRKTDEWIVSSNMWLNRTAMIYQIFYKEKTNEEILVKSILNHISSKEFFHRKAMGWALRQYAKVNPTFVKNFVQTNSFSGLTAREALKHF